MGYVVRQIGSDDEWQDLASDIDPNTGIDRQLEAVKKKGKYEIAQKITKNGKDFEYVHPSSEQLNLAFKKGYQPSESFSGNSPKVPNTKPASMFESGVGGALQGLTDNFSDEALAAVQAPITKQPGQSLGQAYDWNLDYQKQRLAQQKQDNPITSGASEIAGAFASPSPTKKLGFGMRAAESLGRGVTSSLGAAENKNAEAAVQGLKSGAIGAGIGLAPKALASGQKLANWSGAKAAKSAGGDIVKAERKMDRLPGGREEFGKDAMDLGIVKPFASFDDIHKNAQKVSEKTGSEIGSFYQKLDQSAQNGFQTQAAQAKIQAEVLEPLLKSDLASDRAMGQRLSAEIEQFFNKPQTSFKSAHDFRIALDKVAYTPSGLDKNLNKELQKVRRVLNDQIYSDASVALKDPLAADQLKKLNREYSVAVNAAEMSKDKLQRVNKNRSFSPSDYMTSIGGAVAGSNLGVGGAVGGALLGVANNLARTQGNQLLSTTGYQISKALNNPNFAPFAQKLEKAAQQGNTSLAVTHGLLMRNDPNYRKIVEDSAGQSLPNP